MRLGMHRVLRLLAFATLAAGCGAEPRQPERPGPPVGRSLTDAAPERNTLGTRKVDLVETLHGAQVADPYRWLEDSDSPEVKAWTDAQNVRTRQFVDKIPGREKLTSQIADLIHIGLVSAPTVRTVKPGHRRYFHTKREGAENQPTLYVRDGVDAADKSLIDASGLSTDGTRRGTAPSSLGVRAKTEARIARSSFATSPPEKTCPIAFRAPAMRR
jgi:prolyl oligopeptidase